ncbi:MAG: hypothetical protein OIF57_04160, partial [Marinobacterium sp.]|nr:hypothetical protein [Marinobacterium sp.]
MADSDSAVPEQLAALITAIDGFQDVALEAVEQDRKALLEALAALGDIGDIVEEKVISMIGQPGSYPADLRDLIVDVIASVPDISAVSGLDFASNYSVGESVEFTPGGATNTSGKPIVWRLSDLVGVTASATEVPNGQPVTLTFTGPGSIKITAVSDGAAAHISKSWSTATTAPAMTQPTVNNLGDVITVRPVVVTSAYV